VENWFSALTFYALRNPRYQRAEVCWSESVARWKQEKLDRYPTFEEWKRAAAQCDDGAHLLPEVREVRASRKLVAPDRLAEAVSRYIDWEAFAYWARSAMELTSRLPTPVAHELELRCLGFLRSYRDVSESGSRMPDPWARLMGWINDQFFADAKAEGWFDAILIEARIHPRAIRTMEYADHCDELWGSCFPEPYPSFDEWRRSADSYVEAPAHLEDGTDSDRSSQ